MRLTFTSEYDPGKFKTFVVSDGKAFFYWKKKRKKLRPICNLSEKGFVY